VSDPAAEPVEIVLAGVDWGEYMATFQIGHDALAALMYAAELERAEKAVIINRALLLYAMVLDAQHGETVVIRENAGNVWRRVRTLRARHRSGLIARIWNTIRPRKDTP